MTTRSSSGARSREPLPTIDLGSDVARPLEGEEEFDLSARGRKPKAVGGLVGALTPQALPFTSTFEVSHVRFGERFVASSTSLRSV